MSVVSAATFDVLKERVQATHVVTNLWWSFVCLFLANVGDWQEAKDTSGGCGASFEVDYCVLPDDVKY